MYIRHRYYVVGIALNYPVPNTVLMRGEDQLLVTKPGYTDTVFVAGQVSPESGDGDQRTLRITLHKQQ